MTRLGSDVCRDFFAAMQRGAVAEREMEAVFSEDAVYVEPFTGAPREHVGKAAVMAAMREGWKVPMPDVRIEIDRIEVDGERVLAEWTCHSPTLPGGRARGRNQFVVRDGRIVRLETTLQSTDADGER